MTAVLLAGLFAVPTLLLWLGHGLRRRPARLRGAFWGGVAGHSLGMLVALAAAHAPPVLWADGGWRSLAVHASLLAGALLGATVGAARRWRGEPAAPEHRGGLHEADSGS